MKFTTATLFALLPLALAAPAKRENWDKEPKEESGSAEVCKSDDKDWTPYYRPADYEPKPYHVASHPYDDTYEYTSISKYFEDESVENFPEYFTSGLLAYASPYEVVNSNNTYTPGADGSFGTFAFGLNAWEDVICYNIVVYVRGQYQSPAQTATHIHQAPKGQAGPPRLAFPNPMNKDGELGEELELRKSYGCLKGPFTTGIVNNGVDTAEGFTIKQLEEDPMAFFADTHTAEFVPGAVRGQLKKVKSEKKYHH